VVLDAGSRREILRVEQAGPAHQGGTMRFDEYGHLWVGLGDGGFLEGDFTWMPDPLGHGQDPHSLPGSLIRIDVDGAFPYAIPGDNPFVGGGGAPEVWAYGLRNPWGLTFERELVLIADVGRGGWEEVNVVSLADGAGSNFGWSIMEGPECFQLETCDDRGLVPPELALPRPDLCAVIGGPVYRGAQIPEVAGQYFYADLCTGWVRSALVEGDRLGEQTVRIEAADSVPQVTAFFVDSEGEMYLLTLGGEIHRIEAQG